MAEGSRTRRLPDYSVTTKTYSVASKAKTSAQCSSQDLYSIKNRKTARILAELPKNQIAHKTANALKCNQSKSNSDLTRGANERDLKGKILSCENVSRIAKNSRIPRATSFRKAAGESFGRAIKYRGESGKTARKPEKLPIDAADRRVKENLDCDPSGSSQTLSPASLQSPTLSEDYQKILLGKSDSCESKPSSGDLDDSIGPISDDDIMEISGDVTIRKEALDIAVKLASRTSSELEESSTIGFSELAMLDILGGSDLNLNVAKNELSFAIFEDVDSIIDSSTAIDRQQSVDDLRMDCEEISTAQPGISARSPSPNEELPLSSRTPNAPVSIITSITSIMSLDTGYQGDGELSRPESRSAEVDARLKIPAAETGTQAKFDDAKTMTDSDFFTESDADVHDDLSAAAAEIGSGKGDRKAQVIDGTLYGGASIHKQGFPPGENENRDNDNQPIPFASNSSNEDMASSGVFSDVEKKSDPEFQEKDRSEACSCDDQMEANNSLATPTEEKKSTEGMVKSSSGESSSTIHESASNIARTSSNVSIQESDRDNAKWKNQCGKNKMPNRNVTSKVKVLIESAKTKPEPRPKTIRKGKWDAVMDRIAQGKEENKYSTTRFRDVKSKVYDSTKPRNEEAETNKSMSTLQSKARSRRNVRLRGTESNLVSSKASRKSNSPNSSQRSSISDISLLAISKQKQKSNSNQNGIPAKSASASVIGTTANNINSNNNNAVNGGNKHKVKTLKMVQKKPSPVPTRSKDLAQQKNGTLHIPSKDKTGLLLKQLKYNSRAFESLAVLLSYCTNDLDAFSMPNLKLRLKEEEEKFLEAQTSLRETERRMQAQLDGRDRTISDLETANRILNDRTEELEELMKCLRTEEETLRDSLTAVEEKLRVKTKEKEEAEEEWKRENEELAGKVEEATKLYGMMKKLYDKIKLEMNAVKQTNARPDAHLRKEASPEKTKLESPRIPMPEVTPDRLESEVESLRQVLALKTDEVSELRRQELILRENADRVPKLVSTIALLEGKVEDFQTQLSSQSETNRELEKRNYHLEEELKSTNLQKLRLTQKNEELQYKLRQYAEALRQLVNEKNLTEDDIRNVYLYPKTPQKGDCSLIVDSLPAQMKGVVQKSDSVSYMLEMTEDSNEIVTNIIRRAESMRYSTSRSQTLPKKKRPKTYSVSSMDALSPYEDFCAGSADKPCSSATKFPFDKSYDLDSDRTPKKNKIVKLNPNDFIPDSIDLPAEDVCEIIEITKSFDRTGKQDEPGNEMSLSSCSSSSENGNNYDIESDIYPNAPDDGFKESVPLYDVDESTEEEDKKSTFTEFPNAPKTSGGEALIGSNERVCADSP